MFSLLLPSEKKIFNEQGVWVFKFQERLMVRGWGRNMIELWVLSMSLNHILSVNNSDFKNVNISV
jgi:hypothetical protein